MEGGETGGDEESIGRKLDYLTDLFVRRLAQSKESARAFDALYAELKVARATIDGMLLMPLARRMFMLIDRLDQEGTDFAETVCDELAEMLHLHGFSQIIVASEFDPATQEAVAVPVRPGDRDGQIVGFLRRGWLYNGTLVRPALVEVTTPAVDASTASSSRRAAAMDAIGEASQKSSEDAACAAEAEP